MNYNKIYFLKLKKLNIPRIEYSIFVFILQFEKAVLSKIRLIFLITVICFIDTLINNKI